MKQGKMTKRNGLEIKNTYKLKGKESENHYIGKLLASCEYSGPIYSTSPVLGNHLSG